jgi:ribonuclease E
MAKKMLIDACHPEETRVAVLDGQRVDDFDFETQAKKQLRGNIYLAKVTRVEPSLQAAFVEFGGNRHGFLAFGEIHPDYYQIPSADREALKAEFEAMARANQREAREEVEEETAAEVSDTEDAEEPESEDAEETEAVAEDGAETTVKAVAAEEDDDDDDDDEAEAERRRRILTRRYKIQEVIRRRQIMLVQVVKEERGNKGAALTTYLSLAGRYCVLMPNSGRGGGISRKISAGADRKRLKKIAAELEVPHGMGLIVRTAGAKRTKTEIKRDYEYLIRAWETIRDTTMRSVAPAMIYEESSLVKRAIRDLYDKEVDEIFVEGDAAYREAKDFVRMLMPSHAKKVHHYREPTPIFSANGIERQLETVFDPVVHLRSGGYLVINQTEALVAIDVNSGRATRERGIEQTAFKTNLEAADEAARQMRMRDLAGLIVIDFIDMEDAKNDRAVEKRMKDALRFDRARVQMGKISSFGLMELSRQRRRTSVLEGSSHVCEHCGGSGRVRSVESSALRLLRALDDEAMRRGGEILEARAPAEVAIYLLNEKREALARIEDSRGVKLRIVSSPGMLPPHFEIASVGEHHAPIRHQAPIAETADGDDDIVAEDEEDEDESDDAEERAAEAPASEEGGQRSSRRRRGRRGGRRRRDEGGQPVTEAAADTEAAEFEDAEESADETEGDESVSAQGEPRGDRPRRRRRRRRGRRGGEGVARSSDGETPDLSVAEQPSAHVDYAAELYDDAVVAAQPGPSPAQAFEPSASEPEPQREPVEEAEPAVDLPAALVAPLEGAAQQVLADAEAASQAGPELTSEVDYSPDQERREKFFARWSRWGRKEVG